ncbi:MAG: hypothetical protein VBE63_27780 [Lamprobacter sp.]|uniref:hypothetical protein n=1 Tax=Lamprobacter sp. TaxID=3100796 RepID=UPI002B25B1AB|nr:hypothetical protein [Lamprobacter sp.]MEA3643699.1 hypothetical protein [Lamprobacter sp.]
MSTTPDRDHPMTLPETRAKRLAELERFEHLLFEPMTQADLDRLYALSDRWTEQLGDNPEAIALCDALDDFIAAGIEVLTSGRRLMSRFLVSDDGRLNAGFCQQRLEAMSLGNNARAFAKAADALKRVCLPRQLDWMHALA